MKSSFVRVKKRRAARCATRAPRPPRPPLRDAPTDARTQPWDTTTFGPLTRPTTARVLADGTRDDDANATGCAMGRRRDRGTRRRRGSPRARAMRRRETTAKSDWVFEASLARTMMRERAMRGTWDGARREPLLTLGLCARDGASASERATDRGVVLR